MKSHDDAWESLACTQLERIVSLCERFEADWREGSSTRIEGYLATAPAALRPAVLPRLIGLEVELRGPAANIR